MTTAADLPPVVPDTLNEALGITDTPLNRLAQALCRADQNLLASLVEARHAAGLSRVEVATRMDVSISTVADFEALGADPRLSTIRRYAAAVGVAISHDTAPLADLA